MKTQTCWMAVQVVRRRDDGMLMQWYDGETRATLAAAKADRDELAALAPGIPYVVLERKVTEVGPEVRK